MTARSWRAPVAVAAALALVLMAGGPVAADDMGVEIRDGSFSPSETTLSPIGASVQWHNAGSGSHSVKFADGVESPVLAPGQDYERAFAAAGDYSYACGIHPQMTGIVHVVAEQAASSDDAAGGATAPETDTEPRLTTGSNLALALAILLGAATIGAWLTRRRLNGE